MGSGGVFFQKKSPNSQGMKVYNADVYYIMFHTVINLQNIINFTFILRSNTQSYTYLSYPCQHSPPLPHVILFEHSLSHTQDIFPL